MSSNLEPTNQGVRPNPPPKPECCREKGQIEATPSRGDRTISWRRTQGNSQAASGGRTPLKQFSPETVRHAGGDGVILPEPNKEETVEGEVSRNLPGSQSVAREEQTVRNLGGPADPRRANYGSQAGRSDQRQEGSSSSQQGFRSIHSSQRQGASPDAGQGVDTPPQPAQETSPVRTTGASWRTSLLAMRGVVKSPVRENRPPGSVRGAPSNRRPYRDHRLFRAVPAGGPLSRGSVRRSRRNFVGRLDMPWQGRGGKWRFCDVFGR